MNATPPVLPAFIPEAGAAAAAAEPQSPPAKSDGSPTFAGTLRDVGANDGRGAVTAKARSGETVPPPGNKSPPLAAPPSAAKPAAPSAGTAARPASSKAPKQALKAAAVVTAATVPEKLPATVLPAQASIVAPIAGQPDTVLPGEVSAGVTESGSAIAPTEATGDDSNAVLPQAPAATSSEPAAASAGSAVVAGGKSGPVTEPPRPSFKTALLHPATALNAAADSDAGDAARTTAPVTATETSTAIAAAVNDTSPAQLAVDASQAVALAAPAESRNTYSVAASDSDSGDEPDALAASAVAGATLTDASLKTPAGAAADAVQTSLLRGIARTDKHSIDAVGPGAADSAAAAPGGTADAAAGVSQTAGSNAGAAPDTAATPTVRVAANVDSADFPQDLSSRVSWMVDNNLNGAKLQVNPPSLGPIELRILVSGDHAQVWMSSHSAVTRDALESSTPKLREMLGTQGFSQVSVDISQRSFQERSTYSQPYEQASTLGRGAATAAAAPAGTTTARSSLGIVDAYA